MGNNPSGNGLWTALLLVTLMAGCGRQKNTLAPQQKELALRALFQQSTGVVELPAGAVEISTPLEVPAHAKRLEIRGSPSGSLIRAAPSFTGRALIHIRSGADVRIFSVTLAGNRDTREKRLGIPPSDAAFSQFYEDNGLVAEDVDGLEISGLTFRSIINFTIIVNGGKNVMIHDVKIYDCGSLKEDGRNNTTGGILLEEGTRNFTVKNCTLTRVGGNGIWTPSRYTSPRNAEGLVSGNRFTDVARDAIQIGHATKIRVVNNSGSRIGYPVPLVDAATGGIPVAIDTAGNTDQSTYEGNQFHEVNGKCIDLDGFHHGVVKGNVCSNRQPLDAYPFGHYGIVFNNANPDMRSEGVEVVGNVIDGAVYGGAFVIGRRHRIAANRFVNLNLARCTPGSTSSQCLYWQGEPDLLRAGIYLGGRAERPADAVENVIENNQVSGFGMKAGCVVSAPGLPRGANRIAGNEIGRAHV